LEWNQGRLYRRENKKGICNVKMSIVGLAKIVWNKNIGKKGEAHWGLDRLRTP